MDTIVRILSSYLAAWVMAAALVLAALTVKSRTFPRWAMVTSAAVFGTGLIVSALVAPDAEQWNVVANGSYGALFIMMLGGTPARGPRWCHSPWALIGGSALMSVAFAMMQLL
ncbi:MAG TPA: hypothetical protein VJY35_11435 [Candidatus Eisenbacteria bacterium]|nr:hypothetical protein [Candidatus Eisenbacteria bacterium]